MCVAAAGRRRGLVSFLGATPPPSTAHSVIMGCGASKNQITDLEDDLDDEEDQGFGFGAQGFRFGPKGLGFPAKGERQQNRTTDLEDDLDDEEDQGFGFGAQGFGFPTHIPKRQGFGFPTHIPKRYGVGDFIRKDQFIQDLDSTAVRKIARATGKYFDPEALLESIATGSIALVRGRWLLAHAEAGGKLMRRQDLPPEAFFSVEELRKLVAALGDDWGLLFVAISYRWLTAVHPDPDAFHLNIIAKVAKLYLKFDTPFWRFYSPLVDAFERAGMDGRMADFGLMWDFMSLHQKPVGGGERTDKEAGLFKLGLGSLPIWYGHAETVMWMQPELPDGFAERVAALGLAETYEGSGWCFVESSVSAGVKRADRRLDLGLRTETALETEMAAYGKCSSNESWLNDMAPETYLNLVCSAKRPPPRDPDWVAQELRTTKKFTGKGDVPVVEALYRDFFEGVAATATTLKFSDMQWGDAEAAALASTLPRYVRASALDVSKNCIGGDGAAALARAMALCAELKHVDLSSNRLCGQWYEEFSCETDSGVRDRKARQCGTYDASGIIALAETLKVNRALTTLNLAPFWMDSSRIGLEGGMAIADALDANVALIQLTMEGTFELNIPELRGTEQVEALDLSNKRLGIASGLVIAKLLEGNTVLQELDLSRNELCGATLFSFADTFGAGEHQHVSTYDPTSITALAKVLRGQSALTSLDVGHNLLEEEAVLSIVRAVRLRDMMTSLGFASCKIGPVGAKEIADYVQGSVALRRLSVANNPSVVGEAAQQLSVAVLGSPSLEVLSEVPIKEIREDQHTELNLCSVGVEEIGRIKQDERLGSAEGLVLAELIKFSAVALTSLDVRGNEFDAAAKQALQDAVRGRNGFELRIVD